MASWIAEYKYRRFNEIENIINDVYRFTCSECGWATGQQGISFQFCPHCGSKMENASDPRIVPMERIERIKSKIPELARFESADGQDLVMAYDVLRLIDEVIGNEN